MTPYHAALGWPELGALTEVPGPDGSKPDDLIAARTVPDALKGGASSC